MDIEYLRRFIAIGQFLNFRKASDALFVSQPALSHSIAALEKEIGTAVFIRNTKNVSLTPAGNILLDSASQILDIYEKALSEISKVASANDNILRIGYVGAALDNSLTPLIRDFKTKEPDIDVQVTHYHGKEIRKVLEDRIIQFAVSYIEYIEGIPNINYEILDNEEFYLLVNSTHPLAVRDEVSIEEIAKEPLIICDRDSAPYFFDKVMGIFNSEGLTPNIVQKVRLISDIYRLVDMGAGLCIMSYSPKRQFYNSFELKFIPIRASDPSILEHPKTLAWCSELSPAAKKLVKTAKAMYDQS